MSRCILRLSWLPPSSLSSLLPVGEGSGNAGVCAPGQRCPPRTNGPLSCCVYTKSRQSSTLDNDPDTCLERPTAFSSQGRRGEQHLLQ